jgi:Ca-activated chloride channel homolog
MSTTFDDVKIGVLLLQNHVSALPLKGTRVAADITGAIARVDVTQEFANPYAHAIDLEYLFPLPHEAAVVDYVITIGTRTIRADIQEMEAARRTYEQAVRQGKRASLLEQRRPNLFSIQLGNVQPKETIITQLVYEDRLKYEDGAYEFVFPMGITPRYHTQSDANTEKATGTTAPIALDETQVAPVEISVKVDAGAAVGDATSKSHPIQLTRQDGNHFSLTLEGRHIPNKDFVLRYPVGEAALTTALWSSPDADAETTLMYVLPPRLDLSAEPAPREFIFVIDRSGSMSTDPMTQAKNALRACLRALGAGDTFMIQAFDDHIEWFDEKPRKVTQADVDAAEGWLNQINSRGGTEIMGAIDAALVVPADQERTRYVVFLTDGAVSADDAAISKIARQRGNARIFTFGIGPSVNRYLLAKMAQMGRGTAEFMGSKDDIEGIITRFQDRVSYPALLDVALEWRDATAWDTYPDALPDVYVGQPLEIVTKLQRTGANPTLVIRGKRNNIPVEVTAALPKGNEQANPTIARLHARARIEALMDSMTRGGDAEVTRQQIISLALKHRIITRYTSFVAVDSEIVGEQSQQQVSVAVPLPDGLDLEGFGLTQAGFATGAGGSVASFASPPPAAPRMMMAAPAQRAAKKSGIVNNLVDKLKSLGGKSEDDALTERLGTFSDPAPMPMEAEEDAPEDHGVHGILPSPQMLERMKQMREKDAAPAPITLVLSADEVIKQLARTQNVNGSWGNDIEQTAAALLVLIRHGHTTRAGNYRRQIAKTVAWLHAEIRHAKGFVFYAVTRALQELEDLTGDGALPQAGTLKLPPVLTEAERAARGDDHIHLPEKITSLDDARCVGIMKATDATPSAFTPDHPAERWLMRLWLAAGK